MTQQIRNHRRFGRTKVVACAYLLTRRANGRESLLDTRVSLDGIDLSWRLDRTKHVIARLDLARVDHLLGNECSGLDEILTHEGLDAVRPLTSGPIDVERDHGDVLRTRIADDFVQTRVGDRHCDTDDIARHSGVYLVDLRRVIATGILDLQLEASDSCRFLRSVDDRHKEAVAGTTLNLEQDRFSA